MTIGKEKNISSVVNAWKHNLAFKTLEQSYSERLGLTIIAHYLIQVHFSKNIDNLLVQLVGPPCIIVLFFSIVS
jgi:hypothetical protein